MAFHIVIYLIMVIAVFDTVYAGVTRTTGNALYVSLGLLTVEGVVFAASGMRCPLTALAKAYSGEGGYVGDSFVPERYAKRTFRVFGTILLVGLLLLTFNYLSLR